MTEVEGVVHYGRAAIRFKVIYVRRKTLEIGVHPDRSVVVKAPLHTDFTAIKQRVLKRAGWINRQRDYFRQFEPRTPPRQYVGGETHLYLGRRYRLKIDCGETNEVKLKHGFFKIRLAGRRSPESVKRLLEEWYAEKAGLHFNDAFNRCWQSFEKYKFAKPQLQIRRMNKRWGSLSKNGRLTLNNDLIRAPKDCIDYVITHELCHLCYHDHGPEFYKMLERMMPDWTSRKAKLEISLV